MSELVPAGRTAWVRSDRPSGDMRPAERAELHAAIRFWYGQGMSDNAVAMHAGCSNRTVQRYRYRHHLPAFEFHIHQSTEGAMA